MKHSPDTLDALRERLGEAHGLVRQAIAETRELCATLWPGELRGARLIEEIQSHAVEFSRRAGLTLSFTSDAAGVDFPEPSGRNIYRIAQEALSNISRHSSASAVTFALRQIGDNFLMTISDNGVGFDPTHVNDPHAVGLVGMRERARLIGARLELQSTPGRGTTVLLEVPLANAA